MPRISVVSSKHPTGELAEALAQFRPSGADFAVVQTMSMNPRFRQAIAAARDALLAPESPLSRAQYEMIASYVSAVAECHYCLSGHAGRLARLGEEFAH